MWKRVVSWLLKIEEKINKTYQLNPVTEQTDIIMKNHELFKNDSIKYRAALPLYQGLYNGPEGKELTVSLRTAPCRFNCIMCVWKPRNSAYIKQDEIIDQIKHVMSQYRHKIPIVKQFSFGNEGSLLDEKTLKMSTLLQITEIISSIFPRISFETQVIFITQDKIDQLKQVLGNKSFEFTIGFETADNHIRQKVLRKGLPLPLFENKIRLLSKNNIFTKVYVMLKPSPFMDEKDGIEDCVKTIKYLNHLQGKYNNPIVVHLNPTFIVKGSKFEQLAMTNDYTPPKLWSIGEVLYRVRNLPVKIQLGLSTEGLELHEGSTFGNCMFCSNDFLKILKNYNKHHCIDKLLYNLPKCDCRPDYITF